MTRGGREGGWGGVALEHECGGGGGGGGGGYDVGGTRTLASEMTEILAVTDSGIL